MDALGHRWKLAYRTNISYLIFHLAHTEKAVLKEPVAILDPCKK